MKSHQKNTMKIFVNVRAEKYCSNDNDTQSDNCDLNLGIELCVREH